VKAYETVTSEETKKKLSDSVTIVIETATDPSFYSKIKDKTVEGAEAVAGYTFMVNLYCFPNDQAYDKVTEDGIVESLKNGAKSISEATLNATTQGVESLQKFVEPETQQEPDREVHYFDDEAEAEEQDKGFIVLEEKKGIQ
jgi:hypothetical protein